jgi:hypothetical protein
MVKLLFVGSEPMSVTSEQLVALKAFALVTFYQKEGEFHAAFDVTKAIVQRFLKALEGTAP